MKPLIGAEAHSPMADLGDQGCHYTYEVPACATATACSIKEIVAFG